MKFRQIHIVFLLICSLYFISCDREVSTSPPDPPVSTGLIAINSNPQGAAIYMNEKNTGRVTPDSMSWMQGGVYKLRLKLPFFMDSVLNVQVNEGSKDGVFVDFLANPRMYGSVYCSSVPNRALILLNHKPTGQYTPYTLTNLIPGRYTLSFQAFGCREDSQSVNIYSNTTANAAVLLKDTTIWMDYNVSNSPLPSNFLTCVAVDNYDIKWIGTSDKGLVSFDDYSWKTYDMFNSRMPGNAINCITISSNGRTSRDIWIGTDKGLVFFDGGSWMEVYTKENSMLPDNYVTSVAVDRQGNIWAGTMGGLAYIPKNTIGWKAYTKDNSGLPDNWVSQVGTDINSRLWVGTANSGLAYFDLSKNWVYYTKENSKLPGSLVSALCVASTVGGTWVGFVPTVPRGSDIGGLAVFENNLWNTNFKDLPSNNIESIILHNNVRWVCTTGGLLKYMTNTSKEIINTGNSKLPSNHVKYVAFDSNEAVWIVTATAGMVRYKTK